ncbi:hypothetical protein RB595_010579 [Gaeumannomyces hyphopodioides]
MGASTARLLLFLPVAVLGAVHHMYVGNLGLPARAYSLRFDDVSHELAVVKNITASAPHAWISFNHDKSYLYGVSLRDPRVSSYEVRGNGTDLALGGTLAFDGSCAGKTSAFVQASSLPPYRVYTAAWPGPEACGAALAVGPSGAVGRNTQSWRYLTASGVHGLAFGRRGDNDELIYSADLNGDSVWTHKVDGPTGVVTELARLPVANGSHPRHLAAHPNGTYLYVLMEAANRLTTYSLDPETGVPTAEESSYYLLPKNITQMDKQYWSAEVMLSRSARFLWATARAWVNTTNHGYVNGFLLDREGRVVKHMFQERTTTTGGYANAISPAPFGDEWAAMTDVPSGYVQMWRMTGRAETGLGIEYAGAEAVAKVDIVDGGCCANVVWYD